MTTLLSDIETDGLLDDTSVIHSVCIIEYETGHRYTACKDPTYVSPNRGWRRISIEEALVMLDEADLTVFHNGIKFDRPAIKKVAGIDLQNMEDSLVYSRLIWSDMKSWDFNEREQGRSVLPGNLTGAHSLKSWGYRLGLLKGEYGETTDWSTWDPDMQSYCEQDVEVLLKLWDLIVQANYSPQAVELEHQFAEIMFLQEQNGFHFDTKEAVKLYQTLVGERLKIVDELKDKFPPKIVRTPFTPRVNNAKRGYVKGVEIIKETVVEFNPSSRQMIADRLMEKGWKPKEFTPSGQAKIDETILSGLPYPEAAVLARHFLIEKRIGQLAEGDQAWLRLYNQLTGCIHGSVNPNGAATGRCTHSFPNVAQVPSVGSPYGVECRSLFGPRPGWVLVGADLSGLELRCLAHFMGLYDGGAYGSVLLSGDIHWQNVQALGLTDEARDDHNPFHILFRNGAKTFIYGFLYGAGDVKIGSLVLDIMLAAKQQGLEWEWMAKKYFRGAHMPNEKMLRNVGRALKERFLNKTPALKKLREKIGAQVKARMDKEKRSHIKGLDGRLLNIRSEHAALNTLLQSAGALISKMSTILAYQDLVARGWVHGKDFAFCAHVHDEMQVECRPAIADEVGKILVQAMVKAGEHFNFRCPIDGEYKIGRSWYDTH